MAPTAPFVDPYRCTCGAELDHPGAPCDACGDLGDAPAFDAPEADRLIDALARASFPEARFEGYDDEGLAIYSGVSL